MVDHAFVARTLDAARRAHLLHRQLSPRMVDVRGSHPVADPGSAVDAHQAAVEARALRQQAHDADPDHIAPAWLDDPASHDDLMAYYAKVLA